MSLLIPQSVQILSSSASESMPMPTPVSKRSVYGRARALSFDGWKWLVETIDLGRFPIPIKVALDRDSAMMTIKIMFCAYVQDVLEPIKRITIAKDAALSYDEAFSMSYGVASAFIRRQIQDFVLHELAEHLWIGGEREDPHR